jgi:uncharacterized protein YaaW (UPF0174 family)
VSLEEIVSTTKIENLLASADVEDINVLVDYLTDSGEGRLSLDSNVCKRLVQCKEANIYSIGDREIIAKEIRLFGGNSLFNLLRKDGVPYEEIVQDVASHQKVNFNSSDSVEIIEREILAKILSCALQEMSEKERKAIFDDLGISNYSLGGPAATAAIIAAAKMGGFATYKLATIVANAIARALLGKGLAFGATAPLMQSISVLIGPVGWVATALWTAYDLASPAYRVTVPCIVQLAYIRHKSILKKSTKACRKCNKLKPVDASFCPHCGAEGPFKLRQ